MMKNCTSDTRTPVLLCILDGWGHREDGTDNAIARAVTPNWDRFTASCPMALLGTSGLDVGLPDGQMGNSEVGHMTIGSGRVILQDLPRINSEIKDKTLAKNATLGKLISDLKESGGTCHLAGLLSPGGVHSHQDQMVALCEILDSAGVPVALHGFMDGRDTPPTSGADFLAEVLDKLDALENVSIASLCGRYFAMDRDNNWDRVSLAYNALFHAQGTATELNAAMMRVAYEAGENDEFLKPRVAPSYAGIKDGDAVLVANFRADRARELLHAILDIDFDGFDRGRRPALCNVSGMVEYSAKLSKVMPALYPPVEIRNTLGDVVARAGKTQLRIAETEKYAHVTFFLNGGEEQVFEGEERILVPSPKVATYDLQPEMSAPEVKQKLIEAIEGGKFDLIVVNFANPDMVGHTGVMEAAIQAVQTIDTCIGDLQKAVTSVHGTMFITADHGNIELMKDPKTQKPHTAHTTNLVPFLMAASNTNATLQNGTLADIAPTLLKVMGLQIPEDMSGKVLIKDPQEDRAVS